MALNVAAILTLRSGKKASLIWIMVWLVSGPSDYGMILAGPLFAFGMFLPGLGWFDLARMRHARSTRAAPGLRLLARRALLLAVTISRNRFAFVSIVASAVGASREEIPLHWGHRRDPMNATALPHLA